MSIHTVTECNVRRFSWGTMRVLRNRNVATLPLHAPEAAVVRAVLADGCERTLKDETRNTWKVQPRDGGGLGFVNQHRPAIRWELTARDVAAMQLDEGE